MTHPRELFRFCPSCGSATLLPCNTKAVACSMCSFQYYINPAAAVAGIITHPQDNTILMTVRNNEPKKGKLDLPGGFVDYNESAENALKREILEELNIEICDLTFFCSFPNLYTYKNVTYNTLDLAFICTITSFDKIRPQDDVADFLFMDPHEIKHEDIAFNSIIHIIQKYCRG